MSENKKYYWLKLKEDFFEDETIKFIEEQENGIKYSNFYLKLCLKSVKTEGKLIRLVGETLIPYDINSLSKLTGVDFDTVRSAMNLFESIGLVKILESGEIYLSQIDELIGSETNKAQLMRRLRAQQKKIKGNAVTQMLPEIDMDIDIDKEKDIYNIYVQNEVQKPDWEDKFEQFWKLYPRKQNKKKVQLWFKNKQPNDALFDTIIKKLKNFIDTVDWQKENGKYIPMPTTWLNGERWNDEIKSGSSNNIFYEIGKEEGLFWIERAL